MCAGEMTWQGRCSLCKQETCVWTPTAHIKLNMGAWAACVCNAGAAMLRCLGDTRIPRKRGPTSLAHAAGTNKETCLQEEERQGATRENSGGCPVISTHVLWRARTCAHRYTYRNKHTHRHHTHTHMCVHQEFF